MKFPYFSKILLLILLTVVVIGMLFSNKNIVEGNGVNCSRQTESNCKKLQERGKCKYTAEQTVTRECRSIKNPTNRNVSQCPGQSEFLCGTNKKTCKFIDVTPFKIPFSCSN
jgi:hypothetical protein